MKLIASVFSETYARWFRRSITPMIMVTLLGLIFIGSGCSDDNGDQINFPTPAPPAQRNWLFDVFGTAADDVYACGNKGAMFHFDGTSWIQMEMGTSAPITTIWGPPEGPLYAAGHDGHLWQLVNNTWSTMSSGTTQDLFGLGMYQGNIHVCGAEGTLRRLSGNTWAGVPEVIVLRDPEGVHAPIDTLNLTADISSLLTINSFAIGGAFKDPNFIGEGFGMEGTDGMILGLDSEPENYDWVLRPLRGDQLAESEWIICSTNSTAVTENNYLGTSEGWIFQLGSNQGWNKLEPDVTTDAKVGIRGMWLDENSNLYFVTDSGDMIFQTREYHFPDLGLRKIFPVTINGLTNIWGADTDHLFMTGFTENMIIQAHMDFSDTTLVFEQVEVEFSAKSGNSLDMFEDHLGMPRF